MTPIEKHILRSLEKEPRRWRSEWDSRKNDRFWERDDGLRIEYTTTHDYKLLRAGQNAPAPRFSDGRLLERALAQWAEVDNKFRLLDLGEALGLQP